jgi:hypothetical protein
MVSSTLAPTMSKDTVSSTTAESQDGTEKDTTNYPTAPGEQLIQEEREYLPVRSSATVKLELTTGPPVPSPPVSPHPYTGIRWILLLLGLYLTAFLYGLDNTIVANIQGSIISDFGHVERLSWLGSGFPLGSVATILPMYVFP